MIPDLLLELDMASRKTSQTLEYGLFQTKLPSGFTEQHYPLTGREQRELRRLKAAALAAPNVDTFVALCKGRPVPAACLDPKLVSYRRRIGR